MKTTKDESCLSSSIRSYIDLKQALGRQFRNECWVLNKLEQFMIALGATDLTQAEFESWCKTCNHLSASVRRYRMRVVRNLCLYRSRSKPSCFVPDEHLFPMPGQAIQPHIYSEAEIVRLLAAAAHLRPVPRCLLRSQVFRLAIILLYTTGMRRGELVRLTLADYDQKQHTLHVRKSKFHKSRYLPLSADASREVDAYLAKRQKLKLPMLDNSALLWNGYDQGRAYSGSRIWQGIHELLSSADIRKADGTLPRVHDLRFSFAIHVLLRWYRAGLDIQAKLPLLSTYMGHVSIASTEYYLPFIPDLATEASNRFCSHFGTLVQPLNEGGSL
jgi:integrase